MQVLVTGDVYLVQMASYQPVIHAGPLIKQNIKTLSSHRSQVYTFEITGSLYR